MCTEMGIIVANKVKTLGCVRLASSEWETIDVDIGTNIPTEVENEVMKEGYRYLATRSWNITCDYDYINSEEE